MRENNQKDKFTVRKDFPGAAGILPGYTEFFNGLKAVACSGELDQPLGQRISDYVMQWLEDHPLDSFDRYSEERYVRDYIGRCPETLWEAIVMTWKKGNTTTIHGHPRFAGYYFADGKFLVEVFEKADGGNDASPAKVRKVDSFTVDQPKAFFAVGTPGTYDNHIHRLTCLSDTGHSLHVYSDDALKGEVYTE